MGAPAGGTSITATSSTSTSTQKTSDIVQSLRPAKAFKPPSSSPVTSLTFSDNGEHLLATEHAGELIVYNALSGTQSKHIPSQKYGCHLARFTHTASTILYASTKENDFIRLLSTHDNSFIRYFKGHSAPVTSLEVCPGKDEFLSCSVDNTVRIWDHRSQNAQGKLNLTTPYLSAWDPSASVIAIASASTASVLLYDVRNYDRAPFETFDLSTYLPPQYQSSPQALIPPLTKLSFSNNGKSLLVGTNLPTGHLLLDAFSGHLIAHTSRIQLTSSSHGKSSQASFRAAPNEPGLQTSGDACLTADGRFIISSAPTERGGCLVWDTAQKPREQDNGPEGPRLHPIAHLPWKGKVGVVEWNPRYNMMASADDEVVMWVVDEHVVKG